MLGSIAIFLAAAVIAVPIFKKLGLGSVLGYLAAGLVIGPSVLGLVWDVDDILHFAEFGVVLLLFIIGLELQPSRLWGMRRAVFGVGGLQVGVSAALIFGVGLLFGLTWQSALVVGLALALSSTAFAMQVLAERRELTRPHGQASFGVLLFQDLAAIPILAMIPFLKPAQVAAGGVQDAGFDPMGLVLPVVVLVGLVLVGKFLLKPIFRLVAQTHVHELSIAFALLLVIGTALLMSVAGLSMALGAFVAGVMLSDSEYRHELEANIEPFKGLLLGLFFMAVGMSVNVKILIEQPLLVLGLVVGLVGLKFAVLMVAARMAGLSGASAVAMGIALSQGGEFAYVIFQSATTEGVMGEEASLLVMVVTLSMVVTPLMFLVFDAWLKRSKNSAEAEPFDEIDASGSVVIAGFGRFGQVVGRVLGLRGIPFTAMDASATHVDFVRRFGNKIYYGDATKLDLLRAAGAENAKVFVIAVDDMETSLKILEVARSAFPHLKFVARARNRQHAYALIGAGVEHVIRETFASSVQAGRIALELSGLPSSEALKTERFFVDYDEEAVRRSAPHKDDMDALIKAAQNYAEELESIFKADESADKLL
jgi:monovalent cation:proton antiporter-2 (CPA2) family protein